VYNDHDRPSTRKMIVTAMIAVAGVAGLIGIASVVFGITMSKVPSTETTPLTQPTIQAPETATATIPDDQPAKASTVSTADVAASLSASSASTPTPAPTPKPVVVAPTPAKKTSLGTVVVEAGHQAEGDSSTEPIGPGASEKRAKVAGGATGVATHVAESKRNLQVALVLKKSLEARGVKVIMVRTKENVNIANSKRAKIANEANADLFVRLHCDSAGSSTHGILTLRPAKNWYKGIDMVGPSKTAASYVHKAVLAETGAHDRGIDARGDLSGFNWAKVPSVLVEMGLMSNAAEDRKMGTDAYQKELADGIAAGVVKYLKSK
jgi:N-acetylmuramoyl-L-alanine amidase